MDETEITMTETVGQRLKAAREAKGLTIEEIAASTRIPTRHLESLENSDWERLPAPTYSMGFAKNYAAAVGLDRAEIADQLRAEMGSIRPAYQPPVDQFEPADPKRVMPKGLVLGALAALVLVALGLTWFNNRELAGDGSAPIVNELAAAPPIVAPVAPAPVVITANEPAWIDVRDGDTILKQGELAAGQSFEVPATAVAPTLTTAKPEALRISVGTADAPPVGVAGTRVDRVSLLGPDLLKGPAASPASATPTAQSASQPAAQTSRRATPTVRRDAPKPTVTPVTEPAPQSAPAETGDGTTPGE